MRTFLSCELVNHLGLIEINAFRQLALNWW